MYFQTIKIVAHRETFTFYLDEKTTQERGKLNSELAQRNSNPRGITEGNCSTGLITESVKEKSGNTILNRNC